MIQTRQIRAVPVSECATPDHGMEVGPETHTSRWWLLGLMGVHAALLCYAAVRLSPTWDEPRRLSAGVQRWAFGDFALDIGNPPLVSLVAGFPVNLAGARIGDTGHRFAEINGPRVLTLVTIGRLACIPFSLLGIWICWRWGTELYGARLGFFAALLWCFCPLVLAHGPLVTADVASASLGACAFFALRQWLCNSTWPRAVIAGLLLGVALLTKYVWVIMPGLWVGLWLFWRSRERGVMPKRAWLRDIRQIGGMAVVALYVVNAAFGFKGSFHPLAEHPLWRQTKADQPISDGESPVVRWLGRSPVPLPRDFLGGIGAVADSRAREHTHYFNGSTRQQGSPWFYIVGLTLKLPLGGIALIAWATAGRCFRDGDSNWQEDLILAVPVVALLIFVTWATSLQYVRYILPVLPFVLIWTSRVFRSSSARSHPARTVVVCGLLVWYILSSMRVYPHSLSYMNELAGGPERGHYYLVDSDFDWGQDLYCLKEWLDVHPEVTPLRLVYFGSIEPVLVGIDPRPAKSGPADWRTASGPQPGWYAVSATHLRGRYRQDHRFLLEHCQPVTRAGYSIYIYHLTLDKANRVREKMGLSQLPGDRMAGV